jgi:gamma-D-glutamyl-L-lysine dipeptidyl-peptidase
MLIKVPVSNMYLCPDETASVVSQAIYGHDVEVIGSHEGYSNIQTADGYQGWMDSFHLCRMKKDNKDLQVRTVHNMSHVYQTPHVTKQKPVISLPYGVVLNVIQELPEEKGRWIEVELINGSTGWIQRGNVTFKKSKLNLIQMLQLSHQFVGLPYTWGGTSSFGYDCSGFIQMLFNEMGLLLPRDAHQQMASPFCTVVDENEMRPGDLIFYGLHAEKIQHVSLYLGDDKIIQASVLPVPLVQVSPIDEPTLKERYSYSTFRRVIS